MSCIYRSDRSQRHFVLFAIFQFWVPTQFVLFGMISEHWQVPFACVMGMLWSSILSLTAGSAKASASAGSKAEKHS